MKIRFGIKIFRFQSTSQEIKWFNRFQQISFPRTDKCFVLNHWIHQSDEIVFVFEFSIDRSFFRFREGKYNLILSQSFYLITFVRSHYVPLKLSIPFVECDFNYQLSSIWYLSFILLQKIFWCSTVFSVGVFDGNLFKIGLAIRILFYLLVFPEVKVHLYWPEYHIVIYQRY